MGYLRKLGGEGGALTGAMMMDERWEEARELRRGWWRRG